MARRKKKPRLCLDDHISMAKLRELMEKRTDADPFGAGFEPIDGLCNGRGDRTFAPAYDSYQCNPSGEGKPNWQRGYYRLFGRFLVAFEPDPKPGWEMPESTSEEYSFRTACDPGHLIEELGQHLAGLMPDEGLTREEFAELMGITPDEVMADIRQGTLPFEIRPEPIPVPTPERSGWIIDSKRLREMIIAWTHH